MRHWARSSNILNSCSAIQTAGTAFPTTHHMPEALNLLTYIMQEKSRPVPNCTQILVYWCSQT